MLDREPGYVAVVEHRQRAVEGRDGQFFRVTDHFAVLTHLSRGDVLEFRYNPPTNSFRDLRETGTGRARPTGRQFQTPEYCKAGVARSLTPTAFVRELEPLVGRPRAQELVLELRAGSEPKPKRRGRARLQETAVTGMAALNELMGR